MLQLSRRSFLTGATAAPLIAQTAGTGTTRPNIVLILTEDLGAWMCGCYGGKEIRTPNIDLLARLGVRFLNAYVVTPAGSPSRATILTGRTPAQHGIHDFITANPVQDPPQGQAAPSPWFSQELLLSDILSEAGYNCGYVGKWDMGSDSKPGHGISFSYITAGPQEPYQDPRMFRNGETVNERGYLTGLITGAASEFISQQDGSRPFFLCVSYPNPADPYDGHPQKFYDMYAGSKFESLGWLPKADNTLRDADLMEDPVAAARRFAAGLAALDHQLPVLQSKLREKKLWTDTLVVFTSVCGNLLGRHGLWGAGLASNPPNMYDEVVQVPLLASWPGQIPVEASRPEMVSAYDVLPTISAVCGQIVPESRDLCGRGFHKMMMRIPLEKGEQRWPSTVFGAYQNTLMARDNRFKLVVRNGGDGPNEFYRNRLDPRELRNEYSNASIVTVRDSLREQLDAWAAKYAD